MPVYWYWFTGKMKCWLRKDMFKFQIDIYSKKRCILDNRNLIMTIDKMYTFLGISFTKKENMKGDKTWNFVTSILLNEAEPNFFYHVFLMISLAFKFSTASIFYHQKLIRSLCCFIADCIKRYPFYSWFLPKYNRNFKTLFFISVLRIFV